MKGGNINEKISIAVIGLSFGASFARIYAHHPNVKRVILVDNNKENVKNTLSSIIEGRKSHINEDVSANITAAGVCAHISAMNGGTLEIVPEF